MEYTDYARIVNAIAASFAFIALMVRANDDWLRMSPGWRVSRISTLGLIFVFGFGSVELMLQEPPVPLGIRVYLAFTCLVGITVGMYMVRKETGMDAGWIKASRLQEILDKVEDAHNDPCHNPGCLVARDEMRAEIKEARRVVASSL